MSERDFRRRLPPTRRRLSTTGKVPRPSPSPSPLGRRRINCNPLDRLTIRNNNPTSGNYKKDKFFRRSMSEPNLWKSRVGDAPPVPSTSTPAEDLDDDDEGVLFRPRTCTDIFSTPDHSLPQSPGNCSEGYNKDAKVVVNVTVEGSTGPIRTMVKLGSNVEEIIKLVVKKYNEEGRTPHLDKNSTSTLELHHSHFNLESLSKSDLIGDVGSRSFYLRKCNSSSVMSDDSRTDRTSASSNQLDVYPLPFLPSIINRKMKKMIRRMRKVWRIFGCIPG